MTARHVHENDPPIDPAYLGPDENDAQAGYGIPDEIKVSIDIYDAGREMEDFEASPAGKRLIDEQKDALQAAFNEWIELDDPMTDAAKACHFRARVAAEVITSIRATIDSGKEAERFIKDNT